MSQEITWVEFIPGEEKSIPDSHNRDFPVVAPLGYEKWGHDTPYPYAAIIAVEPNQILADEPRPAIFVLEYGGFLEVDCGLLAVRDGYPLFFVKRPFPELMYYLRKVNKSISPLLNVKENQKPWIHVKNCHEQDLTFSSNSDQFNAAVALMVLKKWGEWESENKSWRDRMGNIWPDFNPRSLSAREAAENLFAKNCKAMGLKRGDGKDFKEALEDLDFALDYARISAARMRADQEVQ